MKTIKVDNVEVSVDQIKKAMKEHPELFKESNMPWRAELDGKYWTISNQGKVDWYGESGDYLDDHNYLRGEYFKTEKEAQAHLDRLKATGKVRLAILEANDGWEPDWSEEEDNKYLIRYDNSVNEFSLDYNQFLQTEHVLPRMKSSGIAKQIIKDYEPELKLIFNVK